MNVNLKGGKLIKLGTHGVGRYKSLNLKGGKLVILGNEGVGRQKSLIFNLKGGN